MTEDEAKGKSCCGPLMIAATLAVAEIARLNGKGAEQFSGLCIGSACMAWRYVEPEQQGYQPKTGYCGLAGSQ